MPNRRRRKKMSGWLVLRFADDTYQVYETPGESRVEISKNGYPLTVGFSAEGLTSVDWSAEEPTVKGQTVEEAQAAADEKAAKAPDEKAAKAAAK
jgi:hypothetical protein